MGETGNETGAPKKMGSHAIQDALAPESKLSISRNRIHLSTDQMVSTFSFYRGEEKAQERGAAPRFEEMVWL